MRKCPYRCKFDGATLKRDSVGHRMSNEKLSRWEHSSIDNAVVSEDEVTMDDQLPLNTKTYSKSNQALYDELFRYHSLAEKLVAHRILEVT